MDLQFKFSNPSQREFYYARNRKQCFWGAFNNGKSFGGCLKIITLLLTYPNSRAAICRQTYTDLKKTTMETFFKILPSELVEMHNVQDGVTVLKNGSTIFWLHLDNADENTLRGLEVNWVLWDQAEEGEDKVYRVLLARIGRWDNAIVPSHLLQQFPDWPRNELTGKPIIPSYIFLLCNPPDELHFLYLDFHPESSVRDPENFFVSAEWDPKLGSPEALVDALKNDEEWVDQYVKGKLVRSKGSIHYLPHSGVLEPTERLLQQIKERGNLFRVLDHGEAAPTCCLWFAAIFGVLICYREYYNPGKVISVHRKRIFELSNGEEYSGSYADPQIFKKTQQKDGGFWTVADEYITKDIDAPPLVLQPADNNEFATRNRINELLTVKDDFAHPITQARPSIGLFFIKASDNYPEGCREAHRQLNSQKRLVIGSINGKTLYSDERDENVVDHAYDCVRYFVAMHGSQPNTIKRKIPKRSFAYFNAVSEYLKNRAPAAASVGN